MADLSNLKPPAGAVTKSKRKGRGQGSGLGKTAGRGSKGQRSRSGGGKGPGFEGGQMPLQRRLPKRGFYNRFAKKYTVLNLQQLFGKFDAGDTVDPITVVEKKLVRKVAKDGLKILSEGDLTVALTVKAHKASAKAVEKIQAAGGTFEQLN
ncbi:MAG: 50S ribosomal protein L15 [Candidatus Lernaella stagnicola]|nr:50S ribosomal protein L15 [Candidatus Lernaella stagnicola]